MTNLTTNLKLTCAAALIGLAASPALAETVLKTGEFVAGDVGHDGAGMVSIVENEGQLSLNVKGLISDRGPDLRMILVRADQALTTDAINSSDYIILGDLQGLEGDQSYPIPEGTMVTDYGTAAIWCEQFSVLFTAAALN